MLETRLVKRLQKKLSKRAGFRVSLKIAREIAIRNGLIQPPLSRKVSDAEVDMQKPVIGHPYPTESLASKALSGISSGN